MEEKRLRVRWALSHISQSGKGLVRQKLEGLCAPAPPGFRLQDVANTARGREQG